MWHACILYYVQDSTYIGILYKEFVHEFALNIHDTLFIIIAITSDKWDWWKLIVLVPTLFNLCVTIQAV